MATVKVFGADWCPMTQRTRDHLRRRGVQYQYIDIEKDPEAAEWVRDQNGGAEKKPTVEVGDQVLSEPSNDELDRALERAA